MFFVRKYDPLIHHRRSIRLRGYDYSKKGRYFITICCQGRECRFGTVENGKMTLNGAGKMIEKWYLELPNKFHHIALGQFVVMPNHFHAIIIIKDTPNVGADLRVCPDYETNESVRADPRVCPDNGQPGGHDGQPGGHAGQPGGHAGHPGGHVGPPLPRVVQWFKTMTTNEYIRGVKNLGWERFDRKLWQRDYYEHIICDEKSYFAITNYIIKNPANWKDDKLYNQ